MGAWRVVETLARTGGFGMNVTRRRLLETLQHFLEVMENLDSVKPGGKGFVSSVRVRLLHATVRRRIMKLEREKPGYFDQGAWGIPISDLHQMGTIATYSTALIWEAFPRQGIRLTERQTTDYLALWRWIGHVLGTPVDWMDTPSRAKAVSESIMVSEIEPSRTGQILANNILTSQADVPPLHAKREYLAALIYRLNGDELSAALAIDRPSIYWRALVSLQCLVFVGFGYRYPWMTASQKDNRRKVCWGPSHRLINFRLPVTDLPGACVCAVSAGKRIQDDHEPEARRSRRRHHIRVPVHTPDRKANRDGCFPKRRGPQHPHPYLAVLRAGGPAGHGFVYVVFAPDSRRSAVGGGRGEGGRCCRAGVIDLEVLGDFVCIVKVASCHKE